MSLTLHTFVNTSASLHARTPSHCLSKFLSSTPRRKLSSSHCRSSHYETLSVPRNASKGQIKSSFYRLSKQCHPDVSADPKASEKFNSLRESYAVLSDDRKRREYDRMLVSSQPDYHNTRPSRSQQTQWSYEWSYEIRRNKGATYAWESVRRTRAGHHPGPTYGRHPRNSSEPNYGEPFPFSHTRRAERPTSRQTDADRIDIVSGEWRALQVIALVIFIATIGGGLGGNA